MRPELQREIERLKQILAAHDKPFVTNQGVSQTKLQQVEKDLGFQLDLDLCEFYAMTDGGPRNNGWFATGIQNPVPVNFLSFNDSLKKWQMYFDNEKGNYEYGAKCDKNGRLQRDERIEKGLWFPPQWWAFAVNEWDVTVMLDYRPAPAGKAGQVIAFYHDPDALLCVGDSFLDFFRKSNDFLEARWIVFLRWTNRFK